MELQLDVAACWRSPIKGRVTVKASVAHGQNGGDGIEWWIVRDAKTGRESLAHGATDGTGSQTIPAEADARKLDEIAVDPNDWISLVVGRKGKHYGDTTILGFVITDLGGQGRDIVSLPPHPKPPAGSEPPMQVDVPCARLTAQWNLGVWHLLRHSGKNPQNGRLWFNDHPYGILAAETYMILAALDVMGAHQAAEDGFNQWVFLPMQPLIEPGHEAGGDWKADKQNPGSLPDRPTGNFSDGMGCLTLAEGLPGVGGHMDGVHAYGPGCIGWALTEHYWMTGDREWLKASAPRLLANVEWMLRQRHFLAGMVPGGDRLWCKGLQPAHQATPDSGGLFLQWYWSQAYYCASVSCLAATLSVIDPDKGAKLAAEAQAYRKDLLAAVERSIALSPVVQVRDGTYHSVIPFGCYMRGLGTGAWGWLRDGSGSHWGPLTFETDLSAIPLMSLTGLLPPDDVRVQGYLDVLEDRLLVDHPHSKSLPWFLCGWQHQVGIQKTIDAHLVCDDIPVFLRSFLNIRDLEG